jgi:hypothetical protein
MRILKRIKWFFLKIFYSKKKLTDKEKLILKRANTHESILIGDILKKEVSNYSSGTYGVLNLKGWDKKKKIKHK